MTTQSIPVCPICGRPVVKCVCDLSEEEIDFEDWDEFTNEDETSQRHFYPG